MNEWRQFLQQAHPDFKPLQKAEFFNSPDEDDVVAEDINTTLEEIEMKDTTTSSELEWISPLVPLQNKIEAIPDKMAFKIGEVADIVGVKQYVLRYWESEFDVLHPKKSKNGQRMYSKRDVETALLIRKLLHEDRFSTEGAKAALKKLKKQIRDKVEDKVTAESQETATVAQEICQTGQDTTKIMASNNELLQSAQDLLETIREAKAQLGFN